MKTPYIVVHQKNVEEFDSLVAALTGIDETRKFYHQGNYRIYDFEAGIYKLFDGSSTPKLISSNQSAYETRSDRELMPFAVVDRADHSEILGLTISISGSSPIALTEDNLPELEYHGHDDLNQERSDYLQRKDNDAGLYSLVVFQKIDGPDRGKRFRSRQIITP